MNEPVRYELAHLGGRQVWIEDMGMAEHDGENGKVRYRVGRVVTEADALCRSSLKT